MTVRLEDKSVCIVYGADYENVIPEEVYQESGWDTEEFFNEYFPSMVWSLKLCSDETDGTLQRKSAEESSMDGRFLQRTTTRSWCRSRCLSKQGRSGMAYNDGNDSKRKD